MSHLNHCVVPNSMTPIEIPPSSSIVDRLWEGEFSDSESPPLIGLDEPFPLASPLSSDPFQDMFFWDFSDKVEKEKYYNHSFVQHTTTSREQEGLINGREDNPETSYALNRINILPYLNPVPLDQSNCSIGNEVRRGVTHSNGEGDNPGPSNAGGDINEPPLYLHPASLNQLNCFNGCQILRLVTHTNGVITKSLEIHGIVGFIYHGIYRKWQHDETLEEQFIDFSMQSIEQTKQYLIDYDSACKEEGLVSADDPLFPFYDALCVKMAADNVNSNLGGFLTSFERESELGTFELRTQDVGPQLRTRNTGCKPIKHAQLTIAEQKERIKKMNLRDLVDCFDLTIVEASKKLGICATALKKKCRQYGIPRWPYRGITSIDKQISKLKPRLRSNNEEEVATARVELKMLREERADLCGGMDLIGEVDA